MVSHEGRRPGRRGHVLSKGTIGAHGALPHAPVVSGAHRLFSLSPAVAVSSVRYEAGSLNDGLVLFFVQNTC